MMHVYREVTFIIKTNKDVLYCFINEIMCEEINFHKHLSASHVGRYIIIIIICREQRSLCILFCFYARLYYTGVYERKSKITFIYSKSRIYDIIMIIYSLWTKNEPTWLYTVLFDLYNIIIIIIMQTMNNII